MPVYVSDLFTATPAPVNASPASTRTWQWLRGSSAISGATSATYTAVTADIGSTLSASQLETNFLATTTATSAATEVVQAFDPIRLFSASEPGVWYDPTDISTLYQNAAGTIPVTSFGQPVGLMLDKSRGLVLGPELVVNGDFSGGTTGWLSGAGNTTLSVVDGEAKLEVTTATSRGFLWAATAFATSNVLYKIEFDIYSPNYSGLITCSLNDSLNVDAFAFTTAVTTTKTRITKYLRAGPTPRLYFSTPSALSLGSIIYFDNVSVKELPGLHATQSTEASRPLYGIVPVSGRRNLLIQSETFENAAWARLGISAVTPNAAIAPDGTLTADKVVASATTSEHSIYQSTSGNTGTVYVVAKAAEYDNIRVGDLGNFWFYASFNLTTGAVSGAAGSRLVSASAVSLGNGWWGCTIKYTESGAVAIALGGFPAGATGFAAPNFTGDGTSGVFIWRAQAETGSTATAYQKVTTDLDVTEAGVASVGYLRFDGSTSWMVTPTITPGTDKAQVFAGVRKLSDAASGTVLDINGLAGIGSIMLRAPSGALANFAWYSGGSLQQGAVSPSSYAAPITKVITGIGDISGDLAALRVDGVQAVQTTLDQGTGNFSNLPLYLGRRQGADVAFNGQLFPLIVRFGPTLTAARIAATEAWVATKTGGVTL